MERASILFILDIMAIPNIPLQLEVGRAQRKRVTNAVPFDWIHLEPI